MALLPQSNARLLALSRGGETEDYDRPAVDASPIWQGNLDAYLQEKIVSTFNAQGELRRVMQVTLIVTADIPIRLQAGDILTYQPNSEKASRSGRIQSFVNPANLQYLPDYYKCALEEVNAP